MLYRLNNIYNNPIKSAYFRGNDVQNKSAKPVSEPKKNVSTSIFYINDLHGKINNMSRLYDAKNSYNKLNHDGHDVLCLASGDISASSNQALIKISKTFLEAIDLDANALGNHEFDANPQEIYDINKDAKYKVLGMNMDYTRSDNPLNSVVQKSYVKEINGNKYGIIGLIPPDLYERIRENESRRTVLPFSEEKTIAALQEEVNKLQSEGVNKIIVLSHCGTKLDKKIAKSTSGIDLILGAHTHDLIEGIKFDENLFNSKSGEPVIITQAGKNGDNFGILNVEFDENGVIKSAQNSVQDTKKFNKNPVVDEIFNTILDKKGIVGEIKSAPPLITDSGKPNPHGYIIADACKNEFDTDIAIVNSGNIRGHFRAGILTERALYEITPLNNRMLKMKITEEELVNAVRTGVESISGHGHRGAGFIIPAGFEYTMSHDGELKSITIIDKKGNKKPIDINNPDKNKIYTLATDDFMASGGDKLLPNKLEEIDEIYDFDKDKLVADYIMKLGKPVEIKDDGRIKYEDN